MSESHLRAVLERRFGSDVNIAVLPGEADLNVCGLHNLYYARCSWSTHHSHETRGPPTTQHRGHGRFGSAPRLLPEWSVGLIRPRWS